MITLEQAKQLKYGQVIYHAINKNSDGSPQRWKINGQVKLWKRNPNRIRIPIKHGLYSYDYLTENELELVCLTESEV